MPRETTEITILENGSETHESWIMIRANNVTSNPPARLFDSEIGHTHYIVVTACRCERKRDLNRDWIYAYSTPIFECAMSQAQWGAFVSSFGQGSGVPATLEVFDRKPVAQAVRQASRLEKSAEEVREAGDKALAAIREEYEALVADFEAGVGKKAMRERIRTLGARVKNGPGNMAFAADSLTEHVENVVTKAKADIESMALAAVESGMTLNVGEATAGLLGEGQE